MELLQGGTGRQFGLPQMTQPSDVLGDLYVDPIRRNLVRLGYATGRYADDFRVGRTCDSNSADVATGSDDGTALVRPALGGAPVRFGGHLGPARDHSILDELGIGAVTPG